MKPIDYPADFDAVVSAALARPFFVDARGNLFVLHEDGTTILVAGPETKTLVQFQGGGSGQDIAWSVTQERLFVHFSNDAQCVRGALPRARDSIGLPAYRRSAFTVASPSQAYLIHNTEDALHCFSVTPAGIRPCAEVSRHKGLGAWVEGGNLYVFGMRTRVYKTGKSWFSQGEWFTLKYGLGTLLKIDLASGRVRIEDAANTRKALVAAWKADAGEGEARYVKPLLEAWLDSVDTAHGRLLIGGVMDARLPEFDDTGEWPHPADFAGIALYRWREGQTPELLRVLHGFNYVGQIIGAEGVLLHFVKQEDPRDAFTDRHLALPLTGDLQAPLLPLEFDWAAADLWTAQFDAAYDPRVGALAAVLTTVGDEGLPYRRHLAMSDDGIAWRYVHRLPD